MDRYIGYSAKEFLTDDHFLRWIEGGNSAVARQWETWLKVHPESQGAITEAKLIYRSIQFRERTVSTKEMQAEWEKLHRALQVPLLTESVEVRSNWLGTWWWKVAAIVGLIGLGIAVQLYDPLKDSSVSWATKEVRTLPGEMQLVVLPDGSKVKLNADSKLSYPKIFAAECRTVTLVGEAFFDVERDTLRPFIIHTGKVTTEVLGTSFAIRAYGEQSDIEVAVVEGKVRVNTDKGIQKNHEVILVKDEMATFDRESEKISIGTFDSNEQILWKDGIVHFKKADFQAILKKLERCYGVTFQVNRNVQIDKQWRYTGKFSNKSLEYILEVISYPNRFRYQVNQEFVEITK